MQYIAYDQTRGFGLMRESILRDAPRCLFYFDCSNIANNILPFAIRSVLRVHLSHFRLYFPPY